MHTSFAPGSDSSSLCETKASASQFSSSDLLRLLDWLATYTRIFRDAASAIAETDVLIEESERVKEKERRSLALSSDSTLNALKAMPTRRARGDSSARSPSMLKKTASKRSTSKESKVPELHIEVGTHSCSFIHLQQSQPGPAVLFFFLPYLLVLTRTSIILIFTYTFRNLSMLWRGDMKATSSQSSRRSCSASQCGAPQSPTHLALNI